MYNTDTMKESGATGRVDGPVLERRVDRSVPTLQVSHVAITSPPFLIMYDPNLGTMFCCLVKKRQKDAFVNASWGLHIGIIKSVVDCVRGSSK